MPKKTELMKNWEKDQTAAQLRWRLNQEVRNTESSRMTDRAQDVEAHRQMLYREIFKETRSKYDQERVAQRIEREARQAFQCQREEAIREKDVDYTLTKRRQLLRLAVPELRDLNRTMETQYFLRTLDEQNLENQLLKIQAQKRKKATYDLLYDSPQVGDDIIKKAEMEKKYQLRCGLQDQLLEKEKKKQREFDLFLEERVEKDLAAKQFQEDSEAAYQATLDNAKEKKKINDEFTATWRGWREEEKAQRLADDLKFIVRDETMENNSQRFRDNLKRKIEKKDRIALRLSCQKYEKESPLEYHNGLCADLADLRIKDQLSRSRKAQERTEYLKRRADLRATLLGQIEVHKEEVRKEAEADARYHQQMINETAAQIRLETLVKEKEEMRYKQFLKEAQVVRDEHRMRKTESLINPIFEKKLMAEKEKVESDFIERERNLMIKEKVAMLGSYFPKEVESSDSPLLGPDAGPRNGLEKERYKGDVTYSFWRW